jgi:hypothetical protein
MIGGGLAAPYLVLANFAVAALEGGLGAVGARAVTIALYFCVLPIATGMLFTVRDLEVGAARRLLGVELAEAEPFRGSASWRTRGRSAAWFVGHLVVGLVICLLALVLPRLSSRPVLPRSRPATSSSVSWPLPCRVDPRAPGSSRSPC